MPQDNPQTTPSLLGNPFYIEGFFIRRMEEKNKIWIERASGTHKGESGVFSLSEFTKVVEDFYNERF
jgi:hypothetical protein